MPSAPLSPDGRKIAVATGKGVYIDPIAIPPVREATKMLRDAEAAAGMRLTGYQPEPLVSR